jgi:TatD DNase family protein
MYDPAEVGEIIDNAVREGVVGVMVPATGGDDLDAVVRLAEENPKRVVAAVGVHPHEASTLNGGMKRRLETAMQAPGVVAIGEIGLDYHYMHSAREDQLRALAWQLDLALVNNYPVVLHNRESWDDLECSLASRSSSLRGVCHSFTEGPEEARRVVDHGLLVGISGMVTFKRADNIRGMAAALQLDEILVETDSPYLAPVPYRGRRNQPAHVVEVGRRLADERGLEPSVVAETTSRNFCDLFGVRWSLDGDHDDAERSSC